MVHSVIPYQQWYQVFEWFEWFESIIDLPQLNSIELGDGALSGSYDDSCSLKMESNIDMNELIFRSS